VRTVPIPTWVKTAIDDWTVAAGIMDGVVFRAIDKAGRVWGKLLKAEGWVQEGAGKTWRITAAGRRAAEQPPSANRTARTGSTDAHEA
jgi:hypothetical protein